jgi:hypothetical protein
VKVLDFGLAKLTEPSKPTSETASTMMHVDTDPGTILGTVYYMSPEQARGLAVDGRTDIFSLGVVLYEMITSYMPFGGNTASDVVASILKTEPKPIAQCVPGIPAELQRIVAKALRKDREERYQSVRDMMVDLRNLKQELELEAKLDRHAHAGTGDAATPITKDGQVALRTGGGLGVDTADAVSQRTTSSAEIIINEIKRHKMGAAVVMALLILLMAGVGYGIFKLVGQNKTAAPFQTMKITRLTSNGKSTEAAISPDGKYVVYAVSDAGKQSLWLRQAATSSNVQIAPPAEGFTYLGPSLSRDGTYIYYLKRERSEPRATLYQMPVLGGEPKKLIADVSIQDTGNNFSFSPDGKRLALVRLDASFNRSLVVVGADGTGERELASRSLPNYLAGAAWSPNGSIIGWSKAALPATATGALSK